MASTAQPFNVTLSDSSWTAIHGDDNDSRSGQSVFFVASGGFWIDNKNTGNVTTGSAGAAGRASQLPAGTYTFDLNSTDLVYVRALTGETPTLEGLRMSVTAS